jgi:hypothetical protein
MNPEELSLPEDIKTALGCLLGEGWDDEAEAIVAYIDEQATQITKLDSEISELRIAWAQENVAAKTAKEQIATLKAALVSERAAVITLDYVNGIEPDEPTRVEDWEIANGKTINDRKQMSKKQLAQKYPEFDWKEK